MRETLRNYKISCVGLDQHSKPTRLEFFVYGVQDEEEAREVVKTDEYRQKLLQQLIVPFKELVLRAIICNDNGEVADDDIPHELMIMSEENNDLDEQLKSFSWLNN